MSKRKGKEGGQKKLDTKYAWRFKADETRDLGIFEIRRSFYRGILPNGDNQWDETEAPFTVVIYKYREQGDAFLFRSLFYCDDWDKLRGADGKISDDIQFCCELWEDLGLKRTFGQFSPPHIQWNTDNAPPIIYRNTMENVMNIKYGCGHTDIFEKPENCDFSTIGEHVPSCPGTCIYWEPCQWDGKATFEHGEHCKGDHPELAGGYSDTLHSDPVRIPISFTVGESDAEIEGKILGAMKDRLPKIM